MLQTSLFDLKLVAFSTFALLPALAACLLYFLWQRSPHKVRTATFSASEKPLKPAFSRKSQLDLDKDLYYKLHNLEDHPECLPVAYSRLVSLFSSTLADAQASNDETILSAVPEYDRSQVESFMSRQHNGTCARYEAYLERRKNGGGREMFPDRQTAIWWLRNSLCVKYVDGSWVGHLHKATTYAKDRPATSVAWQVMSEELGDGSIAKNHVYLMEELMREIGESMPKPWDKAFIDPALILQEVRCWKAALAQLTISLFPDRFLPEAMGFNLAYEQTPYHLLLTVKELRELQLPNYYFVLHIAIDNSDSGHAAMGMEACFRYIESQREEQRATLWRRVMTGYVLAEGLPTTPDQSNFVLDTKISTMMEKKSLISHQLHANSKVKIGGCQRLADWLHPKNFTKGETNHTFLREFANAYPWIVKGDPERSLFIKEISWNGRMYGSFTANECKVLEDWITKLGSHQVQPVDLSVYYDFVSVLPHARHIPAFSTVSTLAAITRFPSAPRAHLSKEELNRLYHQSSGEENGISSESGTQVKRLIALHFTSLALLEEMITLPARCSNAIGMHVVQALRAVHGFEETPEAGHEGVSGMDQVNEGQPSLFDLGVKMCEQNNIAAPASIQDIEAWLPETDKIFLAALLRLSYQQVKQQPLLLGLALGSADSLQGSALIGLLDEESTRWMSDLVKREQTALAAAILLLSAQDKQIATRGREIMARRVSIIQQTLTT